MANMQLMMPSTLKEQQKIGLCLRQLDNLITLHQRKSDQLKKLKAYFLQNLFPAKGEKVPKIRFKGFTGEWEERKFKDLFRERRIRTTTENEDTLLSCAINGIFLNSELFSHFRGSSTIGYLKIKKNDLILSAQNLHLGNANVNLKFEHGIISPAYKVFAIENCIPEFIQAWVKRDSAKQFFLAATTEGASQCRKNIEWNTLYNQQIRIPTVAEQKKIGDLTAHIDSLITLHQQKITQLQAVKKFLLQNLFV